MADQDRGNASAMQHGISLRDTDSGSGSASSVESTPNDSGFSSSSVRAGYFAQHGIVAGPNDGFNSLFNRLAIKEGWSKAQRKKRRHEAIADEIDAIYGTDNSKLEKWQELCRDVQIGPVPLSITKCRKALHTVYVNLVNLIDHRRNRTVRLILFPNYAAFRKWTLGGKKGSRIFPKQQAKEEGFIKALLRDLHLF
ncbi:hypothetical protein C7974DRAFT_401976 [Boeremia exigua]|uniref:uncharacterized protein n=1 Tax=Boeremia exigua TaxID=749465 RepID=UPI001E8CE9AE|nr:uncharacterized protein C7974DRAFT_401976 [Boeremia exigua]KAH6616545.1 hypothetical protein C7974DRAFT_401976 [Boeremia exigua]